MRKRDRDKVVEKSRKIRESRQGILRQKKQLGGVENTEKAEKEEKSENTDRGRKKQKKQKVEKGDKGVKKQKMQKKHLEGWTKIENPEK